jgi:hypothetical protein
MDSPTRTPQIYHSFPSIKDPMNTQQLRQKSLHLANVWGKQGRPSPPTYNPFERIVPFLTHQF